MNGRASRHTRLPAPLAAALCEFASDPGVCAAFTLFLKSDGYSRPVFRALAAIARGERGLAWEVRTMAALMLEELVVELSGRRSVEVRAVLVMLGVLQDGQTEVSEWLLAEGFTDFTPAGFFAQLQRKLQRLPLKPRAVGVSANGPGGFAGPLRNVVCVWLVTCFSRTRWCSGPCRRCGFARHSRLFAADLPASHDPQILSAYDARPYEAAILASLATRGASIGSRRGPARRPTRLWSIRWVPWCSPSNRPAAISKSRSSGRACGTVFWV